ncbi:hypothetical protein GCM10009410_01230 [Shewanella ulleungensis]|jgi:hypothetical protein|uniref:Uncharacterized protein n=1 Tax=Shewanella ulleungensis TaxID=2282699 RepID=A0ABQ2QBJ1_9GAMM|nr:hypothetical protein GCM10009410_01230 [Shewanella ulleungensis]
MAFDIPMVNRLRVTRLNVDYCYDLIALGKPICDLINNLVVKINKKKNNKQLISIKFLDGYVGFT